MTDHPTDPTADELAFARRLSARHSRGDRNATADFAAHLMADRLARIGDDGAVEDADHVRMARAYSHVYRECQQRDGERR